MSYSQASEWVRAFAAVVADNKEYLTELDSAIGDADHGINMNRGHAGRPREDRRN